MVAGLYGPTLPMGTAMLRYEPDKLFVPLGPLEQGIYYENLDGNRYDAGGRLMIDFNLVPGDKLDFYASIKFCCPPAVESHGYLRLMARYLNQRIGIDDQITLAELELHTDPANPDLQYLYATSMVSSVTYDKGLLLSYGEPLLLFLEIQGTAAESGKRLHVWGAGVTFHK